MASLILELDEEFYTRNFVELELQRCRAIEKNNSIMKLLENLLTLNFREDEGWICTFFNNYIEICNDVWCCKEEKYRPQLYFEIGFFDCGGSKFLCRDSLIVTVSVYIMTKRVKYNVLCDFATAPHLSINKIVSQLKLLEEKYFV
ncbi:MAG: hypothetical protein FWF56_02960 [Firmicutes bacterium]|nr:hypothetical protein [Bacillota bacterium]MCL1953785.1 hypothetical protein [Bacillota bacterium]